ncbi:MAG TPA: fibronectin type III domain-containing protein, partial [Candidatus Acidoferrum sp.]|nr:fibronectin type III domain-containing protein [Candidatus Acidoferrum sp.]
MPFAARVTRFSLLLSLTVALLCLAGCGGYGSGGNGGGGGGGGTSVPAAPTGLTPTPGDKQVALSWTAVAGATGYYVKRSTTAGGPYTQLPGTGATNFTDTGLTNGTKYYYVVSAYNSYGQSANSTEVNATPSSTAAVAVTVDVLSNRHAINPNVYGGSYPKDAATVTDSGMTVVRWGGNATSRYNWKTFSYNAANDYYYSDYATSEIG